ncbi:hypothetical protein AAC387_Pa08g2525 [Persea americana]
MRGRMERYVVLPFSVGCASYSSIAVCDHQPKKTKEESNPSAQGEQLSGEEMKNSLGFLPIQKANISSGLHRLMKGFKSFSQIFVEKEEELGEKEMEMEMEMEIGSPTDVKHVTHIGWDGSTSTTTTTLDGLSPPPHFLSLPSLSFAHDSSVKT